jgi:hypothetical protein
MAHSSGSAIARQEAVEERLQSSEESPKKNRLAKVRCEIEDRLDYKTVRHARKLAAARGERPMAWEDFKKKLNH